MHIPDGYLSPQTYAAMYGVMTPLWYRALKKVRQTLPKKALPRLALGSAFAFVIMMFNVPIVGGTTGHAVGGALLAIVLGPWAALIAITMALAIQALVFGDGGLTTLATNAFTMAFILPFAAYYIYRIIAGKSPDFGWRQRIGAFVAGYLSISLAATAAGIILGLQPLIASSHGRPLYAPYPLSITIPAMALSHLLAFGFIEGLVTGLALEYLAKDQRWSVFTGKLASNRVQGGVQ